MQCTLLCICPKYVTCRDPAALLYLLTCHWLPVSLSKGMSSFPRTWSEGLNKGIWENLSRFSQTDCFLPLKITTTFKGTFSAGFLTFWVFPPFSHAFTAKEWGKTPLLLVLSWGTICGGCCTHHPHFIIDSLRTNPPQILPSSLCNLFPVWTLSDI